MSEKYSQRKKDRLKKNLSFFHLSFSFFACTCIYYLRGLGSPQNFYAHHFLFWWWAWKTVYGYPYAMLAKDIFVMTVKFRFWFSDYEQKKFCRCKYSVWSTTHEKKGKEQKRVFCSLVIYSHFDFFAVYCLLFFFLSNFSVYSTFLYW